MSETETPAHPIVPPLRTDVLTEEEVSRVLDGTRAVLSGGRFVLGTWTERFERQFSRIVGGRGAVAVNSGTTALEIILRGMGVEGREVLVPTNTNFATARAVVAADATPVLYDGGLYPDHDDLLRRVTPRTAAAVIVHIGGYVDPAVAGLCRRLTEAGVAVVEDAAHAHGSTMGGSPAGTFGYAAAFSFFTTKVITTYEGGAVVSADAGFLDRAVRYRDQGEDPESQLHVVAGNSWRMTEAGAVLGTVLLQRFTRDLRVRNDVVRWYRSRLAGVAGVGFPDQPDDAVLSGHKAIALVAGERVRDRLRRTAAGLGVIIGRGVYDVPLHRQPVFAGLADGRYPKADEFAAGHICLPIWSGITEGELERVAEAVERGAAG